MASRLDEEAPSPAAEDQTSEKSWQKSDREFLMIMITFVATIAGRTLPVVFGKTIPTAGKSIMASKHPSQFVAFIAGVTTAMVVSVMQIFVLINGLPYNKFSVSRNFLYFTMGIAISSMGTAYWTSVTPLTLPLQLPQIRTTLLINFVTGVVGLAILLCLQKIRESCKNSNQTQRMN
ncbi:uncharacterized protein LOC120075488 isoform X1 [Benincasa hispida]|uniref:uncharacterized protein LOC120075488 isoform X1 n=1 Tax=Benincasa hispida TaxID=102211 RepID=UPI0018FFB267|nr:uncharacterized protein LOC120075488 isoform X1 [Benincasa hispida]